MSAAYDVARKAAQRLAPEYGKQLPLQVEKVIYEIDAQPDQFWGWAETLGLAALIVQCAQFGWQIRNDRRGGELDPVALKQQILDAANKQDNLGKAEREAVAAIVADEISKME